MIQVAGFEIFWSLQVHTRYLTFS